VKAYIANVETSHWVYDEVIVMSLKFYFSVMYRLSFQCTSMTYSPQNCVITLYIQSLKFPMLVLMANVKFVCSSA
jgi:hypothetical protein